MTCFLFSFFQDGLKAVDNLKPSIEKLATDLHTVRTISSSVFFTSSPSYFYFPLWLTHYARSLSVLSLLIFLPPLRQIKQVQDEERKQLTQLRDVLKSALQVEQKEVTRTQIYAHAELKVLSMSNSMPVKYHNLILFVSINLLLNQIIYDTDNPEAHC